VNLGKYAALTEEKVGRFPNSVLSGVESAQHMTDKTPFLLQNDFRSTGVKGVSAMGRKAVPADTVSKRATINLIDVGAQAYADCILCQFGEVNILIDGAHAANSEASHGHRSVPDQLAELLGQTPDALHVDLLVVSHAHADHYGCLPDLVGNKKLTASWALVADLDLGWGIVSGETDSLRDSADPRALRLMDLFREDFDPEEEVRPLADYTLDRVSDHDIYQQFLDDLEQGGAEVVSYAGGPGAQGKQKKLVDHFKKQGIGIDILGPSRAQLLECGRALAKGLGLASDFLRDSIHWSSSSDAQADFTTVLEDARSKLSRGGNFVNLQSIVMVLEYAEHKFLFSGDMQTEVLTTQWNNIPITDTLQQEVTALRKQMINSAPYDFIKLGHHGSHNAFSQDLLSAYKGTVQYGITAGEYSKGHPDAEKVLPLLVAQSKEIQWLRTDYNGLCGYTYLPNGNAEWFKESGRLNDPRKNKFDLGERLAGAGGGGEDIFTIAQEPLTSIATDPNGVTRIKARIPFGSASVEFEMVVKSPNRSDSQKTNVAGNQARTPASETTGLPQPSPLNFSMGPPNLGGGRDLPRLLFVTSADQLRNNIGRVEAQTVLDALKQSGHFLVDDLPAGLRLSDTSEVIGKVRQRLSIAPEVKGVVLLGGYDVIPSRQLNTLPPGEESHVADVDDPDKWIVWSDDEYGATEKDGRLSYYSIAVSRIPDQHYAPYFVKSIEAPAVAPKQGRAGIRNLLRPFAAQVSTQFKDEAPLLLSFPTTYKDAYDLNAQHIYFMLHGDALDSMEYRGETKARHTVRAFHINNVPDAPGATVFAGCCWGALTAATPATFAPPNQPIGVKGRDTSIALRFLAKGSRAFVGCTGAHYSPKNVKEFNSAGGAMHTLFWRYCFVPNISGPAEALRRSKIDYLQGMPYLAEASSLAIDSKILHQFTCLGLGW
jgi:beta-lactamase superfamily II metal-dependent hydrolase